MLLSLFVMCAWLTRLASALFKWLARKIVYEMDRGYCLVEH